MNVFAISDLHLSTASDKPMDVFGNLWQNHWELICADWDKQVGPDDLVVLAGDTSWAMTLGEALPDLQQIAARPGKKVMIRGNHDYWWASRKKLDESCPSGVCCLQNDAVRVGNYVICGSRGWTTPETGCKQTPDDAHIYEHEILRFDLSIRAAKKLAQPGDQLIVLSHYPPFNSRLEDTPFTRLFCEAGASAVVYGHLHGSTSRTRPVVEKNGIPYYLTSCDMLGMRLLRIF